MTIAAIKALRALLGLLRRHDFGAPIGLSYLDVKSVEFYESGEIKRIEL